MTKFPLCNLHKGFCIIIHLKFCAILPIDKPAAMCYNCAARGRLPRAVFLSRAIPHNFFLQNYFILGVDNYPEMWYTNYGKGDEVMKNNDYRKEFGMDHFARKYYCTHARLNQVRSDKKQSKKKVRENTKKLLTDYQKDDII